MMASVIRRIAIAALFAVCAVCTSGCAWFRRQAPERIVLIVLDSLRADHVGCFGGSENLTPNIDRLARRSVRFDQCWAASSWTIESNAALLTGRYSSRVRRAARMA